jgi:hypothetical protein
MKLYVLHFVLFCILAVAVFNGVWWLSVPLSLWYIVRYRAYELIFLGFCIDVHFAPSFPLFYYTLTATVLVCFGVFLRPRLRQRSGFYA